MCERAVLWHVVHGGRLHLEVFRHKSAQPMPVSLTTAVPVVQVLDEDDAVQQVTTPRQRNDFLASLTAAEDWLYDQGEDEQASAFRWGPSANMSPCQ